MLHVQGFYIETKEHGNQNWLKKFESMALDKLNNSIYVSNSLQIKDRQQIGLYLYGTALSCKFLGILWSYRRMLNFRVV